MPFGNDLRCDGCGRRESIRPVLYYYQLADDLRLTGMALPCWCYDCDGVRNSETLFTLDYVQHRLHEWEQDGLEHEQTRRNEFRRMEFDPDVEFQKELDKRRAAVSWRIARRSPPRCLTCGSTNQIAFDWHLDPGCRVPDCSGTLTSMTRFHFIQGVYDILNDEGQKVG